MKTTLPPSFFFPTYILSSVNRQGPFQSSAYEELVLVSLIASIGVTVSSLECLSLAKHYRESGLFSWRVHRLREPSLYRPRMIHFLDRCFAYPSILVLFAIRCVAAILIFILHEQRFAICALTAIVGIISVGLALRGPDGKNGSDQMSKMTFVSLALAFSSPSPIMWQCELFFLCGQLCLAYVTSGAIRIQQEQWRDGSYLLLIFRQRSYGNRWCWKFGSQHPTALRFASLATLIFECCFPVGLLLPRKICWALVAIGVFFHLSNAIILGLNTFFWAYVALFPAFLSCNALIHRTLIDKSTLLTTGAAWLMTELRGFFH
jgi:hypothetical protein